MPITSESIERLSNLAFAAALDPKQWQTFLDQAGGILGTRVRCQFLGYDEETGMTPLGFASGYDPHTVGVYLEHYSHRNPYMDAFEQWRTSRVLALDEVCAPEDLMKTSYYADVLKPEEDAHGGAGMILFQDKQRHYLFGGNMRAKDIDAHQQDWFTMCEALAPVMRHSIEVNRSIAGLSFEKWASEQHRLGGGAAILILDHALRIQYASAAAESRLQKGDLIRADLNGKLCFAGEGAQSDMRSALKALSLSGEGGRFAAFRLSSADDRSSLCRVFSLRPGGLDDSMFGRFLEISAPLVVLAIEAGTEHADLQDLLKTETGLSDTEVATVLLLSEGHSTAEIAEKRGVSIYTVRNQIKSALSKTGAHRQLELIRHVEGLRYSLGD